MINPGAALPPFLFVIKSTNYFIKTLALSKKESRIGFRKLRKT